MIVRLQKEDGTIFDMPDELHDAYEDKPEEWQKRFGYPLPKVLDRLDDKCWGCMTPECNKCIIFKDYIRKPKNSLYEAIRDRDAQSIVDILNRGKHDINFNNSCAMSLALEQGEIEIAKLLLEHGSKIHPSAIVKSIINLQLDSIKFCLQNSLKPTVEQLQYCQTPEVYQVCTEEESFEKAKMIFDLIVKDKADKK